MPLEPSPRMRLQRAAGSDAFKRQYFIDLIDRIDNFPGIVVSTSSSPPSGLDWGPAQAGMMTMQSDTGRLMRFTGSSWVPIENYGRSGGANLTPAGATETFGAAVPTRNYTMAPSLTLTRTCTVRFMIVCTIIRHAEQPSAPTSTKTFSATPLFDGADAGIAYGDTFPYDPGTVDLDRKRTIVFGTKSNATPGVHTIGVSCTTSSASRLRAYTFNAIYWLAES